MTTNVWCFEIRFGVEAVPGCAHDSPRFFCEPALPSYNVYKLVGTSLPAGVETKTLEQSATDKARVIATLKASYAHAKAAIRSMPEAALEKTLE